ncbi:hypothetical protein PR048_013759 [Dryococelus australis]|uniref:HTH psq-type domain-containing protein n=1 Tax=Dryococelus australis TaxID=614101 RepID=A0ABQ9HUM7_9NEOP|nr:hypothetical protein PR048_013759 [Dryococelus australis]
MKKSRWRNEIRGWEWRRGSQSSAVFEQSGVQTEGLIDVSIEVLGLIGEFGLIEGLEWVAVKDHQNPIRWSGDVITWRPAGAWLLSQIPLRPIHHNHSNSTQAEVRQLPDPRERCGTRCWGSAKGMVMIVRIRNAELKGPGEGEIAEKTRRPTASSGTIPHAKIQSDPLCDAINISQSERLSAAMCDTSIEANADLCFAGDGRRQTRRKMVAGVKYGRWEEDDMGCTLVAARNGDMSVNEAARAYSIPGATLQRHLAVDPPAEVEHELVSRVLKLEESMFGITLTDLRILAFEIDRHSELSLRQTESSSFARTRGFNKENVQHFYDELERTVDENQLRCTVDETGLSTVQKKSRKVITGKGKGAVGSIASGERGSTSTEICCPNAAGQYVPSLIMYERSRTANRLEEGASSRTIFAYNPETYEQAVGVGTSVIGFAKTGVWPVNRDVFQDCDFIESMQFEADDIPWNSPGTVVSVSRNIHSTLVKDVSAKEAVPSSSTDDQGSLPLVKTPAPQTTKKRRLQTPTSGESVRDKLPFPSGVSAKPHSKEESWYCVICSHDIKEDMIQFLSCNEWVHETCAGVKKGAQYTETAVAERLASSPPTEANRVSTPGRVAPGFSHVGIVPDDAAGQWVFSEIPALSFRLCSLLTSSTLIGSQYLAVES